LDGIRQEIQTVRKDNSSLDAQHHQMTKTLNQLETKAAVLEQEVKNKDLMIDKTNKLLELEREQKVESMGVVFISLSSHLLVCSWSNKIAR
jgi:spindle assembly abnormal protein 6